MNKEEEKWKQIVEDNKKAVGSLVITTIMLFVVCVFLFCCLAWQINKNRMLQAEANEYLNIITGRTNK